MHVFPAQSALLRQATQMPLLQTGVVPEQMLMQLPQWAGSFGLTHWLLHRIKPAGQTPEQTPAVHVAVPLEGVGQTWPQPPQLFGSVLVLTSHPSAVSWLQSAKPWLQVAIRQVPLTHVAVALGRAQTLPQLPQFFGSVLVLMQIEPHRV
jgi:hypothetical protein